MNYIRSFFLGTILSILVFFSVSFVTVLLHINPLHRYHDGEPYAFHMGFPFTYYGQFFMSGELSPHHGWNATHLLYDCLLTWLLVTGIYLWLNYRKSRRHSA